MNKLKQLGKRLGVEAAVVAAILAGIFGLMTLTEKFAASAAEKKSLAEGALTQDNAQLSAMRNQLDRSGEAEKRYIDIQLARTSSNFSSDTDALKEWMRDAKNKYRFANNFKLNMPPEKLTDKTELSGLDYAVRVRDNVTLDLEAMSDLHVISFIEDMRSSAPGIIRIQGLQMERKGDLDAQTIAQMTGGIAPPIVTAKIVFSWVGINEKPKTPAPAGQPVPSMPGGPGL